MEGGAEQVEGGAERWRVGLSPSPDLVESGTVSWSSPAVWTLLASSLGSACQQFGLCLPAVWALLASSLGSVWSDR